MHFPYNFRHYHLNDYHKYKNTLFFNYHHFYDLNLNHIFLYIIAFSYFIFVIMLITKQISYAIPDKKIFLSSLLLFQVHFPYS